MVRGASAAGAQLAGSDAMMMGSPLGIVHFGRSYTADLCLQVCILSVSSTLSLSYLPISTRSLAHHPLTLSRPAPLLLLDEAAACVLLRNVQIHNSRSHDVQQPDPNTSSPTRLHTLDVRGSPKTAVR